VLVELSQAQVDRVVRDAAGAGRISTLLAGLSDVRETVDANPQLNADRRLSQSLIQGLLLLALFPQDGSYLANGDIANELGISPGTAHRYISTLAAVGLLERDPATRRYRLLHVDESRASPAAGAGSRPARH
jgi:DNA-binding MarR family transcriptional regulator